MQITTFDSKSNSKHAISPYSDKTHIFNTYTTNSLLQMYQTMVSNWILNIPLHKIQQPIKTFRRKSHIEKYIDDKLDYFILDIDKVNDLHSRDKILDYFKDYKVIIGESTSYDNISNFNMKGIICVTPISIDDAKQCIRNINLNLKLYCDIDISVAHIAKYNAPIGKNKIIIENENGELYNCDVQHHSNREITEEEIQELNICIEEIQGDSIEELCLNTFKSMGFEPIKKNDNNSITFKHPDEKKSIGGYFWFNTSPYTMNHPTPSKTINIFDIIRKTDIGKELMVKNINYDDAFLKFDTNTRVIDTNEQYLTVEGKEDIIDEFLNSKGGLFSIKSPMGTGKSTIINYIIEECHEMDMKVLIITNRRSVATDFADKYNIKLYNKDKYNLGDSLVVQFDSLWRYDIKYFDLVIMDEFISLMMHSRSNLNNSSINLVKFFSSFNKKLIIADAFLTGYENFLLNDKSNRKELIIQLNNNWRDKSILNIYDDHNYFTQEILFQSKKHKLTISSTSLNFLHSLRVILEKRGLKVVTLTAETPESTKELIYEIFKLEEHDKWDVFLFSPTLTVGVSNLNNIPYHFHYDTSMSTDVVSSIQMLKRTRKAKEIHMFISNRINYLNTTYDDVRNEYMNNLNRNTDQNFMFDVDDYGSVKLSKVGKNAVKIDTFKNILEFNHKKAMLWLLKYHFLHEPRIISNKLSESILAGPSKQLKEEKELILESNINEFLRLNNIEKSNIIMGNNEGDNHKILRILIETADNIKDDIDNQIKIEILKICLKDKQFLTQCKLYRDAYDFTMGFIDENDIKSKVTNAVIKNNSDDLNFYNNLIKIKNIKLFEEYNLFKLKNNNLKHILSKIGYKMQISSVGSRMYKVDENIKKYSDYIK